MKEYSLPPQTIHAWQFDAQKGDTSDQPDCVSVTRQMAGPTAIARPPGTNLVLSLEPGDWLVQLPQGGWTILPAHAMDAMDVKEVV